MVFFDIQHFTPMCYVTAYLHWKILRDWICHGLTYLKVYLTIYSHPYHHWESCTCGTVIYQLYQTGVLYYSVEWYCNKHKL